MGMHSHKSFEIKTQSDLVEQGIKKAGGVSLFAQQMGVTRHTVARWKRGAHIMSGNFYMELVEWIKEKKNI